MEVVYSNLKSFDGSVSETEFNALVDALQSVTLCNGVGYTVSRSALGTVLQAKGGSGGSSLIACPFDVSVKAGTGDNDKIINVRPGTMNQLLPSNIDSDFHFDPDDVIQVKVKGYSDGAKITSAELVVDTANADAQTPTPFGLPSNVEILVAVVVGGTAYREIPCGSIQLVGYEQYRVDKNPAAQPGQLQYTPYYSWILQ